MAIQAPESVRKAWGDEAVADFVPWIERIIWERGVSRNEYREILSRLDILERDVADVRVDIRELRRDMNERFDRMNERFDRMNERFDQMYGRMLTMTRWTVGPLALFGTIISIILAIGQFIK